jgi:DNA-binding transcriptional ArsR family regulator
MAEKITPGWTFLTNHAQVLVCIAHDPGVRLRDIGERVGITERAAHRIVTELADAGYITRRRDGRRNHYTINAQFPLPDPIAREQNVGELLAILTRPPRPKRRSGRPGTAA